MFKIVVGPQTSRVEATKTFAEATIGSQGSTPGCNDDEEDTPAPPSEGIDIVTSTDVCVVKDDELVTMPSSGGEENDEVCIFKRGTCQKHGIKGEKYVQTTRNWRDRGGGRGYAFVTSKRVKYRCRMMSGIPRN